MSHLKMILAALALALGAGAALFVLPARADVTLSVGPSLVELSASPGGVGGQDLTVYNEGSEAFGVRASIVQYRDGEGERSAVGWLRVEPSEFELPPGSQRTVKVSVNVPKGLASGGRYAVVAFRTESKAGESNRLGLAGELGVPFLISVQGTGDLTRKATLERLLPVLEDDGRLGFRALLANAGNLHLYPRGEVALARVDGSSAGRMNLRDTIAVLPASGELLEGEATVPMEEGAAYRARASVAYGGAAPAEAGVEFTASPSLAIESVGALENLDRGPTLRVHLRNDGQLGVTPRVQVAIRSSDGRVLGTARPPKPSLLWPGQAAEIETDYPGRLASGEYVLVARADYGADKSVVREAAFRIGTSPRPTQPINAGWVDPSRVPVESDQGPSSRSWWVGPSLGLGAVLLVFVGVLLLPFASLRRRVRRALKAFREE